MHAHVVRNGWSKKKKKKFYVTIRPLMQFIPIYDSISNSRFAPVAHHLYVTHVDILILYPFFLYFLFL